MQESKSFLSIDIAPDDELSDELSEEMLVSEPEGVDMVLEVQPPMIINSDIISESSEVVELGDKIEVIITAATNVSCSADVLKVLNENMQRSDLLSTTLQLAQPHEGQDV